MIEYDNIIKDKRDLMNQLESLKRDAIENMRAMPDDSKEIFQRDLHALRIAITALGGIK